ncbi:hypothetical protein B0T20DRAFT_73161 [Sordaria brevicollis]|uniref:Uncharacterized protein n=1 Tax=Sordaria brevicollis TaxID=83679 RepID=A0AAE0U5S0_SORBR|nr:hypothetical protein B0T20DRAFT_73161 [Sordaria brevicollis]
MQLMTTDSKNNLLRWCRTSFLRTFERLRQNSDSITIRLGDQPVITRVLMIGVDRNISSRRQQRRFGRQVLYRRKEAVLAVAIEQVHSAPVIRTQCPRNLFRHQILQNISPWPLGLLSFISSTIVLGSRFISFPVFYQGTSFASKCPGWRLSKNAKTQAGTKQIQAECQRRRTNARCQVWCCWPRDKLDQVRDRRSLSKIQMNWFHTTEIHFMVTISNMPLVGCLGEMDPEGERKDSVED